MSLTPDPDTEDEVSLTIGTRINTPFLISKGIQGFMEAWNKKEGDRSPQETISSAKSLFALIPDAWRITDKSLIEEMKNVYNVTIKDVRQKWCGVPIGEPKFKIIKEIDPLKLFHLCINIYSRRGLMARTLYEEYATGKKFQDLVESQTTE